MAWYGLSWWQNVPESDEFVTVLHFLAKLSRGETVPQLVGELLAQSNEHRTLTSRLVFVLWYQVFGSVNFIALAILGCAAIAAAIMLAARSLPDRRAGWLFGLLLTLAVFNLQHYENLFCSCASSDHFLIVLLTTASLVLLDRGSRLATGGACLAALLALLTLTHGLAVLPAGALLLAARRRWRELAAWSALAAAAAALYVAGLDTGGGPAGRLANADGWATLGAFWITLVGGLPALNRELPAAILGLGALLWLGVLSLRGGWRREPLLLALAACAAASMAVIAVGRAGTDTPVLSSRYLIQSAFFWCPLLMATLRLLPPGRWAGAAAATAAVTVAGLSATSNNVFHFDAAHYHGRRQAAAWHYDATGSMVGLKLPLFPYPRQADDFLYEAERAGLFRLRPTASSRIAPAPESSRQPLLHHIDRFEDGRTMVHLSGWLLPAAAGATGRPVLLLREGDRRLVYRGERQARPDVAAVHHRPAESACGFTFAVPKSQLSGDPLQVAFGIEDAGGFLVADTEQALEAVAGRTGPAYRLGRYLSRRFEPETAAAELTMAYHVDELDSDHDLVRVRGWLLPPTDAPGDTTPVLLLRRGGRVTAFRGIREARLDVAEAFHRPDGAGCGFRFAVPTREIADGAAQLALGFTGSAGLVFTRTDYTVRPSLVSQVSGAGSTADFR